jgi:hypothetical protein
LVNRRNSLVEDFGLVVSVFVQSSG